MATSASSEALIGRIILAALDLIADCTKRTLTPRPESPGHPLLKFKRSFLSPQATEISNLMCRCTSSQTPGAGGVQSLPYASGQ